MTCIFSMAKKSTSFIVLSYNLPLPKFGHFKKKQYLCTRMKRLVILICLCLPVLCRAESKLSGAILSSNASNGYSAANAFDGDVNTHFRASDSSYGWVGLDLGTPHVIGIIGYAPVGTTAGANNVQLGIFEGANSPDFMDAMPIYIIAGSSFGGQMNYVRVHCSRGFRYIRYVGPDAKHCVIAEIEIWGDEKAGDDSHLAQLTNLPLVTIRTKNNQLPYDKEHEIDCFISIVSNDGTTLLADTATIRERGNASRGFPKKPYRIKFAHKQHVLGSPAKAKKWTLINNYGDKTLMRNQLAFELSRRFGLPYTPFCAYADVVLNGEYKGTYQLCDQIEVRKNRVDITEMTPRDNSGEALTGGYLFEIDAYAGNETNQAGVFWSDRGTPVTIKSPDEDSITSQQKNYIRSHYNKMESNWKQYLDLNTFLRHFLVGEVSGNTDTYWSTYVYKHRSNDTLYVGPVWDFDLAFDNDGRTYHINDKADYIYRSGGSSTGYMRALADKIVVNDAAAGQQLLAIWTQIRKAGFTEEAMLQYIDEQAQMLDESQQLNFIRWPIMNQYIHQNPRVYGSYKAEVDNVRSYLSKRIGWMDRKLGFDTRTLDVENVQRDDVQCTKVLHDGQVLIRRNGVSYTLTGQIISK